MDLDFVVNKFKSVEKLPGIDAHREMSPMNRPLSYDQIDSSNYKESSVMFFVFEKNGIPHTVVIERNTYNGVHSGQIGLPGGKAEEYDEDLYATALRESNEEIGVHPNHVQLLTNLSTVFIPVSKFIVNPFISILDEVNPVFNPDPREVHKIIEISLEEIADDSNLDKTDIPAGNGLTLKNVPNFNIQNQVIWGATALIFNEVRHLMKS